jgi:protein-disulfide isomerase
MNDMNTNQQSGSGNQEYLSRRERRQLARQQGPGGASSKSYRRLVIWGGSAVLLAVLVWGMVKLSASVPPVSVDGSLSDAVSAQDHMSGPASASVTLVEYSDFQCPACAAFDPVVKKALAEDQLKDKVRLVYRSFPLRNIHPNAELSAWAAEAASLQGRFWEMHDALFAGQASWSRLGKEAARAVFVQYAKDIGIDAAKFSTDIDGDTVKAAVERQVSSGERSSINSTPSFFINGKRMAQPKSYEEFRQFLIDASNANP